MLKSKGEYRQKKVSHGATDLPLTANCAEHLMIRSPSMASCRRSESRVIHGSSSVQTTVIPLKTQKKKDDDHHDDQKNPKKKGKTVIPGGTMGTE